MYSKSPERKARRQLNLEGFVMFHTNTEQQKSGLVAEVRESDNRKIIDRSFQ